MPRSATSAPSRVRRRLARRGDRRVPYVQLRPGRRCRARRHRCRRHALRRCAGSQARGRRPADDPLRQADPDRHLAVLALWGEKDHTMSVDDVRTLRNLIEDAGHSYDFLLYPASPTGGSTTPCPAASARRRPPRLFETITRWLNERQHSARADQVRWSFTATYAADYDFASNPRLHCTALKEALREPAVPPRPADHLLRPGPYGTRGSRVAPDDRQADRGATVHRDTDLRHPRRPPHRRRRLRPYDRRHRLLNHSVGSGQPNQASPAPDSGSAAYQVFAELAPAAWRL